MTQRRPYVNTPTARLIRWERMWTELEAATRRRYRQAHLIRAELIARARADKLISR